MEKVHLIQLLSRVRGIENEFRMSGILYGFKDLSRAKEECKRLKSDADPNDVLEFKFVIIEKEIY